VKDLIFIDPEDETRVADLIDIFGRSLHIVWVTDLLGDVLRELKQGRSHMALVRDVNNQDSTHDPYYELKGIVTLEDVIEEILGSEIIDETDTHTDNAKNSVVQRDETFRWASLRLFDSKIVDQTLSFDEALAVTAHLWKNYESVVDLLTENQLHRLVAETPVTILPTAVQELGRKLPEELLYTKGEPCDFCTLILAGKVTAIAGCDNFRTEVSSWAVLGANALKDADFKPDFSAFVSGGPCRCICIKRSRFIGAIDASTIEKTGHPSPDATHRREINIFPIRTSSERDTRELSIVEDPLDADASRQNKLITALKAVGGVNRERGVSRLSPQVVKPLETREAEIQPTSKDTAEVAASEASAVTNKM
jgi:hypothetical protein